MNTVTAIKYHIVWAVLFSFLLSLTYDISFTVYVFSGHGSTDYFFPALLCPCTRLPIIGVWIVGHARVLFSQVVDKT